MPGEVTITSRVSIIARDGLVVVDGHPLIVACDELAYRNIEAVQWYGRGFGEIEFASRWLPKEKRWDRKPNEVIDDFSEFQIFLDRWEEVKKGYTWTPVSGEQRKK